MYDNLGIKIYIYIYIYYYIWILAHDISVCNRMKETLHRLQTFHRLRHKTNNNNSELNMKCNTETIFFVTIYKCLFEKYSRQNIANLGY